MAKNTKPKINAEAAYENAHLVAQDRRGTEHLDEDTDRRGTEKDKRSTQHFVK